MSREQTRDSFSWNGLIHSQGNQWRSHFQAHLAYFNTQSSLLSLYTFSMMDTMTAAKEPKTTIEEGKYKLSAPKAEAGSPKISNVLSSGLSPSSQTLRVNS